MSTVAKDLPSDLNNFKRELQYAGIHLQEDRDARLATRAAGAEKKYWHMIRVRVPLGVLSAAQYLALDDVAQRVTYNGSLRVTAGQSIQLHGLAEADLAPTVEALARVGLAAGCNKAGLEFAIAAPPVPFNNNSYLRLRGLAAELCDELYPRPGKGSDIEVPDHSPRKFTIGLGLTEDNGANIFAHDIGLLLVDGADGESRINVYAGGSLSMPGRRADTYARLASPLGSLAAGQMMAVVKAIVAIFKRHGQLGTRRHTRLKYVVDALGVDRFRAEVEGELGFGFSELLPYEELKVPSWRGPHDQQNGQVFYGLSVPYGRIQDAGLKRYKTAIRLIVETFRPRVILSPDQTIIFAGLSAEQIGALERILAAYHLPFGDGLTNVRFGTMACAGIPTCPLAIAESERVAPQLVDQLEAELKRVGRIESPFSFRISGCSIGCIRPNMVDLGVIGRKPGHYDLYVGGSEAAGRFGELYVESIPLAEVIPTVRPLLEVWARSSQRNESFSDFYTKWFGSDEKRVRLAANERVRSKLIPIK